MILHYAVGKDYLITLPACMPAWMYVEDHTQAEMCHLSVVRVASESSTSSSSNSSNSAMCACHYTIPLVPLVLQVAVQPDSGKVLGCIDIRLPRSATGMRATGEHDNCRILEAAV